MVLVAAVALGAAACGDDDGGGDGLEIGSPEQAQEAVAAAADMAADAGSAMFTLDVTTADDSLTLSAEGGYSADGVRLAMQLDGVGLPPGAQDMEILLTDDTVYYRSDLFDSLVDTEWASISLEALEEAAGFMVSDLLAGGADPTAALDQLRGAGEVVEIGEEEVRGVHTTHLHAVVDLHDSIEAAPEEQREALEDLLDQYEDELDTSIVEVDVWLDDDGRPVRYSQVTSIAGTDTTTVMELFDWGEPVDLTPPADDEVTDISDQLGG